MTFSLQRETSASSSEECLCDSWSWNVGSSCWWLRSSLYQHFTSKYYLIYVLCIYLSHYKGQYITNLNYHDLLVTIIILKMLRTRVHRKKKRTSYLQKNFLSSCVPFICFFEDNQSYFFLSTGVSKHFQRPRRSSKVIIVTSKS